MARNFEEERKLHQKVIDDNKGNKEIEEAQKAHIDKINKDEEKANKKAEKKAKLEANLSKNDAGPEAVKRQEEATADIAQIDTPEKQFKAGAKADINSVVDDVIAGKYGNGAERRANLLNAGFDPDEVQKAVNAKTAEKPVEEQPVEEQPTEQPVEEPVVEEEQVEEQPVEEQPANDTEVTPEQEKMLMEETEEGKAAKEAVEGNNPVALQNIVTPEGESVLKGSFDANGHYVPYVYTDKDVGGMNKGMAGALTIISIALSALGAAAGIPIVPVNFYKLFGKPEAVEKANQVEKDYADVINGEASNRINTEAGREVNREQNLADVEAYKDISDEEAQKMAQVNAAGQGANAQLDVQREQQEWQSKEAELDREFQKVMNDLDTQSQLEILKQQGLNQQDLAKLMDDLDVQRVFKKIEMAKQRGESPDTLAKWLRGEKGVTTLEAYVGPAIQAAGSIGTLFGLGKVSSDKNVKKFDTKVNSDMLRKAFKWR